MKLRVTEPDEHHQALIRYVFNHLKDVLRSQDDEGNDDLIEQIITLFKIPVITDHDLAYIICKSLDGKDPQKLTLTLKPNKEKTDMDIKVGMNYCCPSSYGDIEFHFDIFLILTDDGCVIAEPYIEKLTIDSPPACLFTYKYYKYDPDRYGGAEELSDLILACVEDEIKNLRDIACRCVYNNMTVLFDDLARFKSKGKGILLDKTLLIAKNGKAELQ